ncbi:hypothetical protein [Bacillus cytotoxicus]|uniref:hypothetical protein n=1 Tax=Bacillus cytotoxicus TaxID=580165 RepID=UPI00244AC5E8|nr:hypothetical protein [Bacillus cytotoxicus]MDH2882515.1 hypothetical protein [Bacillus cytotoxicus]
MTRNRTKLIDIVIGHEKKQAKQCFGPLCNGKFKDLESFHKNKKGLGERKEKCIECVRYERGSKARINNTLIEKVTNGHKVTLKICTICNQLKDLDQFSNSKSHLYNKLPSCKSCESKRQAEYYLNNKEKVNNKNNKYYQDNREEILMRTNEYRKEHRERYLFLQRKWKKDNVEYNREYNQKHYATNKVHYKLVRGRYYRKNKEKFRAWKLDWRENNRELINLYAQRYNAKKKALPHDLNSEDLLDIYSQFNFACALTGETNNLHLDHFICVDTGHVGTIYGNVIPLLGSLNIGKRNKNPFEWIRDYPMHKEKFHYIVSILSSILGLTIKEYRTFVYWCYENPRTVEELKSDSRTSLEIWMSSLDNSRELY